MDEKYSIAQRVLVICVLLFAFSGCSKFGPESGLWGGGRVNPSGVNQLFDKEFEEIDLITLLDPKGKAKEGFLQSKKVKMDVASKKADEARIAADAAADAAAVAAVLADDAENEVVVQRKGVAVKAEEVASVKALIAREKADEAERAVISAIEGPKVRTEANADEDVVALAAIIAGLRSIADAAKKEADEAEAAEKKLIKENAEAEALALAENAKKLRSTAVSLHEKAEKARIEADRAAVAAESAANAKEGIKWEDLSEQEKLDMAFEAFYHESYAVKDSKRRRNQVQERILAASNNRCNLYKAYMKNLNTRTHFLLGATTTILGGAGAIVGGAAARTYAGAAGVVSGTRSEFDQAYYSKKAFGLVAAGIDDRREQLHEKMKEKRGDEVDVYTVEEAVSDAIRYHGACSIDSGLDEAAKKMQMDYDFGVEQMEKTVEHVKKAAELIKTLPKQE